MNRGGLDRLLIILTAICTSDISEDRIIKQLINDAWIVKVQFKVQRMMNA
jgi:hypothetical protein